MAKVCLNMIVKNEMAIIERCLAAMAPTIDCYVICDTGSTDGTQDFIRNFFRERSIPGLVPQTTFKNFEQARNEALDAARASPLQFDYIILCDADMELIVHRKDWRDELVAGAYYVLQRTVNSTLEYQNLRLVRRDRPARYKGVTHEYLDVEVTERKVFDGISYIDHAAGSSRSVKYERDIALLLQGLKDEPENARYVFYLGNSYYDLGDYPKALEAYRRRAMMGGWEEEVFYANYRVGGCLAQLERHEEMIKQYLETFDKFPHRAEPLHALALHYQRTSQHRLAYQFATMGKAVPVPPSALFVEPEVYRWRLADIESVSLYWMGRYAESIALCNTLIPIVPENQRPRIIKNREWSEIALKPGASPPKTQPQTAAVSVERKSPATPYTPAFFSNISGGSRSSAQRILPLVFDLARPQSLVDVGCGAGAWLKVANELGVAEIAGLDGSYVDRAQLQIPADSFTATDLSALTPKTLKALGDSLQRKFDLAMSLEVAEHLPASSAGDFVDSLCALSQIVLFSAALPHQGGTHHINERFPSYWVAHFKRNGFLPIDAVRPRVWDSQDVEWWYRQNTLLFASQEAIASHPKLAAARANTIEAALDIIHPLHYQRVVDWALREANAAKR